MNTDDVEQQDDVQPEYMGVPHRFTVTDEASANWACRKIIEARLYASRVMEWAEREVRRANNEEEWLTRRFGGELEQWARHELASRGGRARSFRLPAAQIGFRMTPAGFRMVDAPALTSWCRTHLPEALRTQVDARGRAAAALRQVLGEHGIDGKVEDSVVSSEVQKHIVACGEVPPGMEAVDRVERFFIR